MRTITYDCEVFAHDWIVVLKDKGSGKYTVIHNDNEALKSCISPQNVYIGFNSKSYDSFIIKAICADFTPEQVKQVNDWIISGRQGWEFQELREFFFQFNNVDVRDDMQQTLSLKAIEGHLGMSIEETEVDFNLDRPLTSEELELTIKYCKHDVDATEQLIDLRSDYLRTKANLGKRAGLDPIQAMGMTNAKLTAVMLGAKRKEWDDGREYRFPDNLDFESIPYEVISFFDKIHDIRTYPDDFLFGQSLEITLGDMPCRYAWGGVHGSLTQYHEEETESRVIENRDVSSLYPSLIELYGYLSRNVPNPDLFYAMRKDRLDAKKRGDKQLANDLKLPLNTVSGAQENRYNDLYDPLPTRSMRISGQLFITMLMMRLLKQCKTIKMLNLNTDGLMYSVDKSELPIVESVCKIWEQETRFELEVDHISRVWIKDVNNLLIVKTDGSVKTVGGYLNFGITAKGAWGINNTAVVVKKALYEYFVHGTPIEDTIRADTDPLDFQFIAKAGSKYDRAFQIVDGQEVPTQKVNRVYATSDMRLGTLYKVKGESVAKIENLPDHCVIDNDNHITIEEIDKSFYFDLAMKRLLDFIGDFMTQESSKKAAPVGAKAKPMNVYQKLLKARLAFLNAQTTGSVGKSGKNMAIQFKYFELDDIVPTVTQIFDTLGLIALVSYDETVATMTVVNTDDPDDFVCFSTPMRYPAENRGVNPVQALGSAHTYIRRYLYMAAMDICEPDTIEPSLQPTEHPVPAHAPATSEQRKEIKAELTAPDGQATELQIQGLKAVMKKVREAYPDMEPVLTKIATETVGFTKISKTDCEKLIGKLSAKLEASDGD